MIDDDAIFAWVMKGMPSPPPELGVVPVRDENGNVVSFTVGRSTAPENAGDSGGGWVTSSRGFADGDTPPTATEALKAYVRARVQARRRLAEEDGVIVDGVVYDTSDDAHLRLMTLLVFASRDPTYTASILVRDGSVRQLTSQAIYSVATAIANHMQACALWEISAMQTVDGATTVDELTDFEATIDDSAPSGDVTTPVAPGGTQPPPAYESATFEDVLCETIRVHDDANVAGDLTVEGDSLTVGKATVSGALTATGDASLESSLTVANDASIGRDLTVAAATRLMGSLEVTGSTSLVDALDLAAAATLHSTLDVAGAATFRDAVAVTGGLDVNGPSTFANELVAQAASRMESTLGVGGDVTLDASLTTIGATHLQATLDVLGESSFNANMTVTGNANVAGSLDVRDDAVVERLYARDKLGTGTMSVNRDARARTQAWIRAGSFFWRRGDRQPTNVTVSVAVDRSGAKAAVALFELERRQVLGYGVDPGTGGSVVRFPLTNTLFTAGDDTAFEIEVYIANASDSGSVTLSNYFVSCA